MIFSVLLFSGCIIVGLFNVLLDTLTLLHQQKTSDGKGKFVHYLFQQNYRLFLALILFLVLFVFKGEVSLRELFIIIALYMFLSYLVEISERMTKKRFRRGMIRVIIVKWTPLAMGIFILFGLFERNLMVSYGLLYALFVGTLIFLYWLVFKVIVYRIFEHIPYQNPFDARLVELDSRLTERIYYIRSKRIQLPMNAMLSGFFRKKVWLSKSLLYTLKADQIQAIIVHELGHSRRKHLLKRLSVLMMAILGYFVILYTVFETNIIEIIGLKDHFIARLTIVLILTYMFDQMGGWAFYRWAQKQEYQADDFVYENGFTSSYIKALSVIDRFVNEPSHHPLYSAFKLTHPPTTYRIKRLEKRLKAESQEAI